MTILCVCLPFWGQREEVKLTNKVGQRLLEKERR